MRKIVQYYTKLDGVDRTGHGTHCAGTLLGKTCQCEGSMCKWLKWCSPDWGGVNRDGSAPDAKLAVYDIGGSESLDLYPDDANPMFVHGVSAGATVHSASWGMRINSYLSRDETYDKFQYENPHFLVVFAAGNDGSGNKKNTSKNVAKNSLNVCATMNDGDGLGQFYTWSNSGMGPSKDGRIKPDICAPGTKIHSARNSWMRTCSDRKLSGTS